MAILINKDIRLNEDLITTQLYGRINYKVRDDGKELEVHMRYYTSKNSYLSTNSHHVRIKGLNNSFLIPYDRNVDGVDVLLFIHKYIINYLTSDTVVEFDRRASSKGPLGIAKFCEESEIEIVDIQELADIYEAEADKLNEINES